MRFTAIINSTLVAILAVRSVNSRQFWNNGDLQWREIVQFSLTSFCRAIGGAAGALFMGALKKRSDGRYGKSRTI